MDVSTVTKFVGVFVRFSCAASQVTCSLSGSSLSRHLHHSRFAPPAALKLLWLLVGSYRPPQDTYTLWFFHPKTLAALSGSRPTLKTLATHISGSSTPRHLQHTLVLAANLKSARPLCNWFIHSSRNQATYWQLSGSSPLKTLTLWFFTLSRHLHHSSPSRHLRTLSGSSNSLVLHTLVLHLPRHLQNSLVRAAHTQDSCSTLVLQL
jgi:hypothetical protein